MFSCEICEMFKDTILQNTYGGCFCSEDSFKIVSELIIFSSEVEDGQKKSVRRAYIR